MTRAMGIDPSTSILGWSAGTENTKYVFGSITLPKKDTIGEKLGVIFLEMQRLILQLEPEIIGIEAPFFPVDRGGLTKNTWGKPKVQTSMISEEDAEHVEEAKAGGASFNPETIKALQKVVGIIEACAAIGYVRGGPEGARLWTPGLNLMEGEEHVSVPVDMPSSSQWRKTFFGYGRKPKGDPSFDWKREARRRAKQLGYETRNADEAEAIGVLTHILHGAGASARKQGDIFSQAGGLL